MRKFKGLTISVLLSISLMTIFLTSLTAFAAEASIIDLTVRQMGDGQLALGQERLPNYHQRVNIESALMLNTTGTYTIFLPLVKTPQKLFAKFGVDFNPTILYDSEAQTNDFPLVKAMGATWVRVWLPWAEIETAPGQYEWGPYDTLFARLNALDLKPLPVIFNAPAWAATEACGPISDTGTFENFLETAVARYGAEVDAWEFINEPDGREPFPSFGPAIGCWGVQPEAYAAQLGIFHNQVKSLDPEALVLFGGLAYDNWELFERNFFDNALKNGAGSFFDVVSLHYYPINPVEFPTMAAKIDEIRETMQQHGLQNKRVWMTETSMWVNSSEGLAAQLDFIVEEQTRGFCAGADNMFWFAVREEAEPPPLQRWLIDRTHQPANGHDTFQHFAQTLEQAVCLGAYHNVPAGVEAYRFDAFDRLIYIAWSNTTPQLVTLPAASGATLTDRDGTSSTTLPAENGQVTFEVGTGAVFVEIAK